MYTVETSVASHDTTGGMETKISEAATIAKLGIDVYIVKVYIFSIHDLSFYLKLLHCETFLSLQAATEHSLTALSGKLRDKIPEDWLGTVIRYVP
ncbi:putative aspartate/glutamate/uridylate kinase, fosfomycin resistance kinase, FomA-type [Helianthus annuus]|nr:putative aspartate/glutamate/uridylate kinase, fosfomycin resistance kinase, FomA-type [Helianthus annuus]